jgi:[NiFe] hydrogenase assembly HybE family chaperone
MTGPECVQGSQWENAAEGRLVQAFERIDRHRMVGLPIRNGTLRPEAVGFRRWKDARVGVLVLPWSLNLVRLPDAVDDCRPRGLTAEHRFPAGVFAFLGNEEPEVGPFEQCSLMSPVLELADQDAARAAAGAAVEALFRAPAEEGTLSRRDLLRGRGR